MQDNLKNEVLNSHERWQILGFNIIFLGVLMSVVPMKLMAESEGFQEFIDQQNSAFQQYITDQEQAFAAYKAIHDKEFAAYKNEIAKYWDQKEVSRPKKWVSYTQGFQQKTVVDYEKKQIIIYQKMEGAVDKQEAQKKIQERVQQLASLTYKKAYEEDQLARRLDKALAQKVAPELLLKTKPKKQKIHIVEKPLKVKAQDTKIKTLSNNKGRVLVYTLPMTSKAEVKRIESVLPDVQYQAKRQKLPPSLLLAIIKNESSYNPLAKSHIPAYGLMQIVPRSAGRDSTKYLFGKEKLLSAGYLYTPQKNIEIGAAYLHILYYRYLKRIKDPESRLYCTIAAYNTGAGNVARAFSGTNSVAKAAEKINRLTPSQVYQHLRQHLPYEETKKYLKKVTRSYQKYSKLKLS